MKTETIEKAVELLQPITYETFDVGYYVCLNGNDLGNSDYCKNCIDAAVKEARKSHKEERQKVLDKFKEIEDTGHFKGVNVKEKYTAAEIVKAKRYELKQYPAKASFTYEGHDPDFGGGLKSPCTCEGCGEAFTCSFEADKEEAEYLLEVVKSGKLSERIKWELDVAFYNYEYLKEDVKSILLQAAEIILGLNTVNDHTDGFAGGSVGKKNTIQRDAA